LVDLRFDDGVVVQEVEEHLIQTNIPLLPSSAGIKEASLFNNNFYDAGVYIRGDYVEVWKSPETGWKRGRIASDKKNGCYDIRLENGFDEIYRGRFMRFHFRSKDIVDVRVNHSTSWITGRILKQEKSGNSYCVHFDEMRDGEGEEKNVNVYRLMPSSRHEVRQKSVEYSQQLEELIREAASQDSIINCDQSNSSSSVHALKYSRDIFHQKDNDDSLVRQTERTHHTNSNNGNSDYHQNFPPPSYPESDVVDSHQRKINNRQQRQQELKRESHQTDFSSPVPASELRNIPSLPSSSVTVHSSSHVKAENVGNARIIPGLTTPLKEGAEKLNKFTIGEKVFYYDDKNGDYQAALIRSFNIEEGTANLTTLTGTILSGVQLRFLVKEDRVSAHQEDLQRPPIQSLQKPPALKLPETTKVQAAKKPHYKKGLKVQVEVEVNQFESITVEGTIVSYLAEGQYSVFLEGENDERIVDESCLKPFAAASSQRNSLTKTCEELEKNSQTSVNPSVTASSLLANQAKVRIQENEEILRFKQSQAFKPSTTRMRHALSYGNEEEMFNLSLAEGEGASFDYLNRAGRGRRNRADTTIDDLLPTKTVPYTVGMNVSYQPPGHQSMGKSYMGIIQKINEKNQTVSLLLEFGNVVENVSFQCILPFSFDSNPSHHHPSSSVVEKDQQIVPQRPSQEKRSAQPFQRKGAGILVSPSSPGAVTDRKHSISGSSSHHWHFGSYSQPATSSSSSSSWKSVLVYYENKNHSFRNYSKIWKEKQFQVRILTENKAFYDVFVLENTHLTKPSISSSTTIPYFLAFPSMEEKDYLTIFWKERTLAAKKPSVTLSSSFMYLVIFEKMKAVTIAQIPLSSSSSSTSSNEGASLSFHEMIFQSVSSEKRQVIDYINNDSSLSSSFQVVVNPEIITQILLPVWELYSCFSREEIVKKFPVFTTLAPSKEEGSDGRRSQNSHMNEASSSEKRKIILVNILLPGNQIASSNLLSRLESLFLSSFLDVFVTFHYYQTSPSFSAALSSSSSSVVSKGEGLNAGKTNKKNILNSFASIYQSIRRNMKLSLLFLFFPISFSQQLASSSSSSSSASNRVGSSMLVISDYDMFQALTNILQNAFPVNTSSSTSAKEGDRKKTSQPSDLLSLLQFWEFQCFNLKSLSDSSSSSSSSPSASRIVGIKWKYWLQFVPYFKLMICYLLVKKILELTLQSSSDAAGGEEINGKRRRRSRNEGRKGSSSRRGSREERNGNEEPIAIDDGYEDYYDWFLALQSCISSSSPSSSSPLAYDYSLSALLLYYDFLTILENHFHILFSLSSSSTSRRGNEEDDENEEERNFFPLKEILISLQQRYAFYSSSSSSRDAAANDEEAIEEKNILFCWNEVFPSFLLKYYSYFIGQQLSDNLNSLLSLLWEKTKVFNPSAPSSLKANEIPQERQRSRTKSDEKNKISIFESLDIYCIALPNHIHFSSASSSSHRHHRRSHRSSGNGNANSNGGTGTGSSGEYQYFLFYCNSLYHDQILLPFLQSLKVPIQQHNSSHYFLSIKDFPFVSIYDDSLQDGYDDDEGEQDAGEGTEGRGSGNGSSASSSPRVRSRSRSHSSHRSRSNSHRNRKNSSEEGSDIDMPPSVVELEREKKGHNHHHQSPRRSNVRRSHHQHHPIKEEEDAERDTSNSDGNNEERDHEENNQNINNSNRKEEFSLQQDFCDQLSDQLKLSSSVSSSSSMIQQQLQFATNQFMKEGFYCLSDLHQLPNYLLKKHLPKVNQSLSVKQERKDLLSKLLSDYLKDLQISLFLQVKLIPYLVASSSS
jgi:hypothetical protein